MLTSRNSIVTPPRDTINIFRDEDGAVYFKAPDGKFHLTQSYYDVYRIENPQFKYYNVIGEKIDVLKSSAKEFIFSLYTLRNVVGGGKGGARGIRGITVQDEGSQVNGLINTLNFEGTSVSVTDDGGGKVTITIGGGGMITGGGTVNRIAMFTPNGSTIGDSPLLRSGSDVIADGFLYFNSGFGIDVLASGGSDVLNIGTTNADVINYGYAGTTHNMNGTVFNVFTTNLNVTDKIITLNDGGAAGSGGNVGFEIEEGGVATGYFIQNTTRDGFDFQASGVTGVATFDLSNLTGNQTATLQDASGTIAYLSDIPTNAFVQNGNSFGVPAVLGTNDPFSLSFETNGTTRGTISSAGFWGINTAPIADQLITAVSTGATNTSYLFRGYNSTPREIFSVRSDTYISAGSDDGVLGFLTIGALSGINTTVSNTFIGVNIASLITTAAGNTAVGFRALEFITSGSGNNAFGQEALKRSTTATDCNAFGSNALRENLTNGVNNAFGNNALMNSNGGFYGSAFGGECLMGNTTGTRNSGFGALCLRLNTTGSFITAMGFQAAHNCTNDNVTAIGSNALFTSVNGENTAVGSESFNVTPGFRVVGLGYRSGRFSTQSDVLYIHNGLGVVDEATGITNSLIYGGFASTTAAQFFRHNSNVGILTNTFGANSDGVLSFANGTPPSAFVANQIQLFSRDSSDNLATLGLFTEQSVEAVAAVPDARLKVWLNLGGVLTEYYIALEAV